MSPGRKATLPCPCGFAGDPRRACRCDFAERARYGRKLSGPLLDRIDLHVPVPALPWADLERSSAEASGEIRRRVARARELAARRRPDRPGFRNSDLAASDLEPNACADPAARRLLATAVERMGFSVRALHRSLKVARTIADLEGADTIRSTHVAEAISYRLRTGVADEVSRAREPKPEWPPS
jgi:magnesium chelatase family protein